ncbi:MAG: hypothetical protein K6E50_14900 [Lachnospiraceae bacterium]|nr:hypothetical protein [Lachnospiraceae bacterium]
MKKRMSIGRSGLALLLAGTMFLGACGKSKEEEKPEQSAETEQTDSTDNGDKAETVTEGTTDAPASEETDAETVSVEGSSFFASYEAETERMLQEAVEQYRNEDHTPLDEPVRYNVLWLGFTHVTYDDLDFQMTDFDREYLEAVALNFEKSVESISNHNVDFSVDLHFIGDSMHLTKAADADWLYLAQETAQPVIDRYVTEDTDTVLTTVQTAGDENRERNASKDGYDMHYVMLGLQTAGMSSTMGYSTFDLQKPADGTYPLADPEIPSLYATAVAVHEWMHQLEYLGTLLGVEYPNTHAYMGPDSFPGYQQYVADENDYDFFEFYKLVLKGELPYTGGSEVKQVGMYPKMWPLIKRGRFQLGRFTIKAADDSGYLCGRTEEPTLDISTDPCIWNIRYSGDGRFVFSPELLPDKLIDLGNAWDMEDNTIGLWVYTGYADAQSWRVAENADGTLSLQTPYESGRLVTLRKGTGAFLCSEGADGVQNWVIEPAK